MSIDIDEMIVNVLTKERQKFTQHEYVFSHLKLKTK